MGMGQLTEFSTTVTTTLSHDFIVPLLNSFAMGCILSVVTFFAAYYLLEKDDDKTSLNETLQGLALGSANLLFICVGLTGIMFLVQNNLARAFAIGAAIALMRFRRKIGHNKLDTNLLYGVVVGVACGLNELVVGWSMTAMYLILQIIVVLIVRIFKNK